MLQILVTVGLLLPLGLDTFALAAALGVAGLGRQDRLRVAVVFTLFEAAMPIAGLLLGRAAGRLIGDWASYGGIAFVLVAGILLLRPEKDEAGETRRLGLLAQARGLSILYLGLSISMDELTIGFSAGLLGLSIVLTVAWVAVQAFVATQAGLWLGARLSAGIRERAEWLAGAVLILMGLVLLVLKIARL